MEHGAAKTLFFTNLLSLSSDDNNSSFESHSCKSAELASFTEGARGIFKVFFPTCDHRQHLSSESIIVTATLRLNCCSCIENYYILYIPQTDILFDVGLCVHRSERGLRGGGGGGGGHVEITFCTIGLNLCPTPEAAAAAAAAGGSGVERRRTLVREGELAKSASAHSFRAFRPLILLLYSQDCPAAAL